MEFSSAVRRRRRSPPDGGGVPFGRGLLGLEFYPSEDDPTGFASSGQAFTKVGAPVLITNGYKLATGDAVRFSAADGNALFSVANAPTGFTAFAVMPRPFGGLDPVSSAFYLAVTFDDGTDYPLQLAMAAYPTASDSITPESDIGYNAVDYEGAASYGAAGMYLPASSVHTLRFDRLHVPAPLVAWSGIPGQQHSGNTNEEGRLRWYQDGVVLPGDGFAPVAPYAPEVSAGTLIVLGGTGRLSIGQSIGGDPVYPRVGAVLIYRAKLSDFNVLQVANWLRLRKPLAGLTMGPGNITNNPFVFTNVTAGTRPTPTFAVVENADVAQAHSIATTPIALINGASVTRTVYVRANPRFRGIFFASTNAGGANRCGINFNLQTQVISNFLSGAGTVSASSITAMGEGWYALTFTGAQNGVDVTTATCLRLVDDLGNATYNGDGTSAIQFA